jgi:hypothetical protein
MAAKPAAKSAGATATVRAFEAHRATTTQPATRPTSIRAVTRDWVVLAVGWRRGGFAALFQDAHTRGFTMDVGVITRAKLGFKAQNVVEEFQCGFKVWHVHERGDLDEVGHIARLLAGE